MIRAPHLWALGLVAIQGCAAATVGASRYLAVGGSDLTTYQVAREAPLVGPINYETKAVFHPEASGTTGWMAGVGADLVILAGSPDSPYVIGGVEAGIGTRDQPGTWASWSVGLGTQLLRMGPLGLRGEARYRRLSAETRKGLELGFRIGRGWRPESTGPVIPGTPRATVPRTLPVPLVTGGESRGNSEATRSTVVGIATEAMGTPYRWGGSSADGFDCSGLIQFAYREVGVALPRRSVEQATAGEPVAREVGGLLPGDILTFATGTTGVVSHVGLYIGDGRFIHSATGGVQISRLSPTDPYGRWWWERWLGARRIVP